MCKHRRPWSAYIVKDKPGCHISNFAPPECRHVRATEHIYKHKPSIIDRNWSFGNDINRYLLPMQSVKRGTVMNMTARVT